MSILRILAAAAMIGATLSTPPQAPAPNAPTEQGPRVAAPGGQAPPALGRLLKTSQGWRASRIIGSPVFNDKNQRIGR